MTKNYQHERSMAKRPNSLTIHTSLLFDSRKAEFVENRSIVVDNGTGLITSVYDRGTADISEDGEGAQIDARESVILPGFVDSHTHIFLHSYSEASSIYQERDESMVERIVRATQHCRAAIRAGYTTYRDLGTEGVDDADVGVRDAINRGLTPGPRLFVATQPLATSSSYAVRVESSLNGTRVAPLSDACDGVNGVTAGVRRRVGTGADLIKFYADYRRRTLRFPKPAYPDGPDLLHPPVLRARNPNSTMFSQEEMNAICAEAGRANMPVAAHATAAEAAIMASKAGVTSVEHGFIPSDKVVEEFVKNDTIFVPTLSVLEAERDAIDRGDFGIPITWEDILGHTEKAWKAGVRIAAGGDTGAFSHGDNAREPELLVEAGLTVEAALQAVTLRGWEACGGSLKDEYHGETVVGRKFGCLEKGWSADLLAISADPRQSKNALRQVEWVMKDAKLVVQGGKILADQ